MVAVALAAATMTVGGFATGAGAGSSGTTIVVTTTEDAAPAGSPARDTCGYTEGAIFVPGGDGRCTLRRAIVEAGARPDADRPIRITFNIPTTDPNYDASLGIWEVQIDESFALELDRDAIVDDGGQVTIDGATQPGGRATGPKIMVDTNRDDDELGGRSFEVRTSDNVIRNLGFHGGGQIILYEGGNTVENVWMGLRNDGTAMQVASDASTQAQRAMARGGIIMPTSDSDGNTIRNNRIIGAFERAIRVTSGGSGNVIEDNYIGMAADGTVPGGLIDCTRGSELDPGLWYGGEGIQVTGSDTTVRGNVLAGLHRTQAANDTPAISLEIAGTNNTVEDNVIGLDATGARTGVCGQGILLQGTASIVTGNTLFFSRNGFDTLDIGSDFDSAIITQSFSGSGGGSWLQVWDNRIDGGNKKAASTYAYTFASPGVPDSMGQFPPARVTSVKGRTVRGTSGDTTPDNVSGFCPGCTIFLYSDDPDDRVESFELLGTTEADDDGRWTATLSRPLRAGEGLRTQSMANDSGVMPFGPRTTSRLSSDLYGIPTCDGRVATMVVGTFGRATSGADVIVGTSRVDEIDGKGGNDVICGRGGNDTLRGGKGADRIFGEGGRDELDGGKGGDRLDGGKGRDECKGAGGRDTAARCERETSVP